VLSQGGPNGSSQSGPGTLDDPFDVHLLLVASFWNERHRSSRCLVGFGCLSSGAVRQVRKLVQSGSAPAIRGEDTLFSDRACRCRGRAHRQPCGAVYGRTFGEPVMTEVALYVAAPVFHFWKAFVPFGLSPAYELRGWVLALGACVSLAVSLWLYVIRKRWPALLASWICYLMLLWLIPNHRSLGLEMLADRRAYLSCIPWAVLTGAASMGC